MYSKTLYTSWKIYLIHSIFILMRTLIYQFQLANSSLPTQKPLIELQLVAILKINSLMQTQQTFYRNSNIRQVSVLFSVLGDYLIIKRNLFI